MTDRIEQTFFRPVRPGNAFEETVQRLLQTIRLGVVAPGEQLPSERELALRFSVSRDTVRDAIRSLADAGYLLSRRGRYGGTFVVDELPTGPAAVVAGGHEEPPDAADLEDALALREVLEVGACRLAAQRTLSAPERERLWTALRETSQAGPEDYRRLDSRLHLTIAELSGVRSLVPLVADNRMAVNHFLDDIPLLPRNIAHSNEQHEAVVSAILAGVVGDAAAAMEEHLAGSASLLRGFLA
ncbi:FadR/GntR family transcriptional regulator [Nocardioides iriomotensis]|uniref:FadR family transcriptional regulator n=1 Tax=Nocardioides iriomotensis TaxID=715784 RepID=A0A4Q5IWG9_9ACTN|nr:GntR family transcriptional regulator [Nocardioides iriomotensis]RYU10460.1 FadR family transcriptional regulator [Nocardioides iriomotensis]